MKTAMQQLLNNLKGSVWYTYDEIEQLIIDEMMPTERQQIIDAFNEGYREGESDAAGMIANDDVSQYDNANLYFNQTYGNEAEAK